MDCLFDIEMERRVLQNNPAGLSRAEIEHGVGNQYNRLLRQQQGSKALSALKCITTATGRPGDPSINSRVAALLRKERSSHWGMQEREKREKSRDAAADKTGGGNGKC